MSGSKDFYFCKILCLTIVFAVTLVRKYGNSVERNYSKRVLREIYRNEKNSIRTSFDIVIVLYPGDYSFRERYDQFQVLIKRANLV